MLDEYGSAVAWYTAGARVAQLHAAVAAAVTAIPAAVPDQQRRRQRRRRERRRQRWRERWRERRRERREGAAGAAAKQHDRHAPWNDSGSEHLSGAADCSCRPIVGIALPTPLIAMSIATLIAITPHQPSPPTKSTVERCHSSGFTVVVFSHAICCSDAPRLVSRISSPVTGWVGFVRSI
eukprot:COSAG02_NODE_3707_length_6348_cov_36.717051_4_plen_180_part_00